MTPPTDPPISPPASRPIAPATEQERVLLEAYRTTDDAGRVIVWAALLAELGRRSPPLEDAEEAAPPRP